MDLPPMQLWRADHGPMSKSALVKSFYPIKCLTDIVELLFNTNLFEVVYLASLLLSVMLIEWIYDLPHNNEPLWEAVRQVSQTENKETGKSVSTVTWEHQRESAVGGGPPDLWVAEGKNSVTAGWLFRPRSDLPNSHLELANLKKIYITQLYSEYNRGNFHEIVP